MLNFPDTRVRIKGIYSRGEIYQLYVKTDISNITIKCSFKLFPLPLYQIAELLYPIVLNKQGALINNIDVYSHRELLQDSKEPLTKDAAFARCKLKAVIIQSLIFKLDLQFIN
jgi:hypothetical protein